MAKIKKFRETACPRYLPRSVPNEKIRQDLISYNRHRLKCFKAKPLVDTSAPKMNPAHFFKVKRLLDDARRMNDIDNENKILLQKINCIHRTKGFVTCWRERGNPPNLNWRSQKERWKQIYKYNIQFYKRLQKAESIYSRAQMMRDWQVIIKKMMYASKYPLFFLSNKTWDTQINEMPPITGDLEQLSPRPLVFMDLQIKDGVKLGQLIIELYPDYAPVTVQNFLAIVRSEGGLTYKNCPIHNIVRGKYITTGDITKGNGKGGTSIYGEKFAEESHTMSHSKPGVLSMVRVGDCENNSQFCITLTAMPRLDETQVVFGCVVKGNNSLVAVSELGRGVGRPTVPVVIANCGELRLKRRQSILENSQYLVRRPMKSRCPYGGH